MINLLDFLRPIWTVRVTTTATLDDCNVGRKRKHGSGSQYFWQAKQLAKEMNAYHSRPGGYWIQEHYDVVRSDCFELEEDTTIVPQERYPLVPEDPIGFDYDNSEEIIHELSANLLELFPELPDNDALPLSRMLFAKRDAISSLEESDFEILLNELIEIIRDRGFADAVSMIRGRLDQLVKGSN